MSKDIKIAGGGDPIDATTVDTTMRCFTALVEEAEAGHVPDRHHLRSGEIFGPTALMELRYHCENPHLGINPDTFRPAAHILNARINNSGPFIGDLLFGKGWQQKMANHEELSVPDERIRAVIAAAKPQIHITYSKRIGSASVVATAKRKDTFRYESEAESGGGMRPMPVKPGNNWTSRFRPEESEQDRATAIAL